MKEIIDNIRPQCIMYNIDLRVDLELAERTQVSVKPTLFERAMHNLLTNAIQAMSNGGRFIVLAEEQGDHVSIFSKDTGEGIPSEIRHQVSSRISQMVQVLDYIRSAE